MEKLVSVIIPVYNRSAVLPECIASIQAQTWQDFEVILVDDGSTDGTLALCRSLAVEDARIRVFETAHVGVSAARNIALEQAVGRYVLFVDSDDVIHPQLMQTLYEQLHSAGAPIGGTTVYGIGEKRWAQLLPQCIKAQPGPGTVTVQSYEQTMDMIFRHTNPLSCIGGVMIERSWIGQTRFRTDLFIGEDFFFIYENLIKGATTVFLDQQWYYVRKHEHNSSWNWRYDGFYTRFLRKKLVWESEERLGRTANADRQKRGTLDVYARCVRKNKLFGSDVRRMRKVMRSHSRIIIAANSTRRQRLSAAFIIYFPGLYNLYRSLRKK